MVSPFADNPLSDGKAYTLRAVRIVHTLTVRLAGPWYLWSLLCFLLSIGP